MDTSFYISIVSGTLLTVSEILPFVKSIQSNGILDFCTNVTKYMAGKLSSTNETNTNESRPLTNNNSTNYGTLEYEIGIMNKKLDSLLENKRINIMQVNEGTQNETQQTKRIILEFN